MNENPFLLDKPLGATPLRALDLLRRELKLPEGTKLAYAGRLDPMATGLLVVLHSELLKEQERFWHLDKIYEATVILGVGSDSHDLLGLAEVGPVTQLSDQSIPAAAMGLVGKLILSVPAFSSFRVQGRPLFQWARGDEAFSSPARRMSVSELQVLDVDQVVLADLARMAVQRCDLVQGDFRQADIIQRWIKLSQVHGQMILPSIRMTISCSAGTYVRSLAHELGRRLGTNALLMDLRRLAVGQFRLDDANVFRFS